MTSEILDRGLTADQMRAKVLRDDRAGWYAAEDPKHHHAILSRKGRVVTRCESLHDRDLLLRAALAHDALVAVVEDLIRGASTGAITSYQDETFARLLGEAGRALAKAGGLSRPLGTTENVSGGRQP